jgi:hypothetical protein
LESEEELVRYHDLSGWSPPGYKDFDHGAARKFASIRIKWFTEAVGPFGHHPLLKRTVSSYNAGHTTAIDR